MTMKDMLCDVCGTGEAIGVASTLIPYSCAYCVECAKRGAQPVLVFECWYDTFEKDYGKMHPTIPDSVVTVLDGRYVTYREWAETYNAH